MKDTGVLVLDAQVSVLREIWTAQINEKLLMKGIDLLKTRQIKLECSDAPVARFYSARCLVIT